MKWQAEVFCHGAVGCSRGSPYQPSVDFGVERALPGVFMEELSSKAHVLPFCTTARLGKMGLFDQKAIPNTASPPLRHLLDAAKLAENPELPQLRGGKAGGGGQAAGLPWPTLPRRSPPPSTAVHRGRRVSFMFRAIVFLGHNSAFLGFWAAGFRAGSSGWMVRPRRFMTAVNVLARPFHIAVKLDELLTIRSVHSLHSVAASSRASRHGSDYRDKTRRSQPCRADARRPCCACRPRPRPQARSGRCGCGSLAPMMAGVALPRGPWAVAVHPCDGGFEEFPAVGSVFHGPNVLLF